MTWQTVADRWSGPGLWFACSFLVVSNVFAVLDWLQPAWYARRAVLGAKQPALDGATWFRVVCNNVRNIVLAYVMGILLIICRHAIKPFSPVSDVGFWLYVTQLFTCYVWAELWFFCSHWWVHNNPQRMHLIHAKHHEFHTHTFAIVGLYCSISEMFVVNLPLSIFLPLVADFDPSVTTVSLTFIAVHICLNHSAHQLLPVWLDNVSYHLDHHRRVANHFGARWVEHHLLPILDRKEE